MCQGLSALGQGLHDLSAEFKSNVRNAWCDCIRGYAILLVCIAHFFYLEPLHSRWGFVTSYFKGDTGVFMFYVLSGFLVTGILSREVEKHNDFRSRLRHGAFFCPSHFPATAQLPSFPGVLCGLCVEARRVVVVGSVSPAFQLAWRAIHHLAH
jgi:hypothetical protein